MPSAQFTTFIEIDPAIHWKFEMTTRGAVSFEKFVKWQHFYFNVWVQSEKSKHAEAKKIWLVSGRQHFPMNFLEWKSLYFDPYFTEVSSQGPIDNKPALAQIKAWCRTGNKPLSEPIKV